MEKEGKEREQRLAKLENKIYGGPIRMLLIRIGVIIFTLIGLIELLQECSGH
jgi:hypothetical protein